MLVRILFVMCSILSILVKLAAVKENLLDCTLNSKQMIVACVFGFLAVHFYILLLVMLRGNFITVTSRPVPVYMTLIPVEFASKMVCTVHMLMELLTCVLQSSTVVISTMPMRRTLS